jgi:CRP-like cAMP-binding protein
MSSNNKLMQVYKTVELLDGLTDAEIQALIGISETVEYEEDELVFAQGEEGDTFYIILEGQVSVNIRRSENEAEQVVVYLGQGQVFGEIVLIDYGKRSASIRASQDETRLNVITRDDFLNLCETNKSIGYKVMRNMAIDLAYKLRHQNLETTGNP